MQAKEHLLIDWKRKSKERMKGHFMFSVYGCLMRSSIRFFLNFREVSVANSL